MREKEREVRKIVRMATLSLVCCLVLVVASATSAFADTAKTVSVASGADARKAIQTVLDEAKVKATASNRYVITVPKGSYQLSGSLKLYSNTTLNLQGVTFTLQANAKSNMIRIGESDDTQTGYYYKNITVNGGTFNANKSTSTVMKAAHAQNVTFNGVTFKNCYNSHLAEVAGIDGLNVLNCTFRDQVRNNADAAKTMSPEALQIDILNKLHFPTYRAEDLAMKNVVIDGTKFINVPRGVGSHTGVYNNPMTNIKVTNCEFSGIDTVAIEFQNAVNLTISGNKIKGAPRGIAVLAVGEQGMFFSKTIANEGKTTAHYSSAYKAPASNQNIVISNNEVVCKGKDPHTGFENEAIVVKGSYFTKATRSKSADLLPGKDHYLSGVTVSDNTIATIGHGIRLRDVKNSSVVRNAVTYNGSKSGSAAYYGVQTIDHCSNNVIDGNVIANMKTNGIYVSQSSQAKSIQGNKITAPGKYGIDIQESKAATIARNQISKAGSHGIYVYKKSAVTSISSNVISAAGGSGINVDSQSRTTKITGNTVKKPKVHGITVHKSSKVTKIDKNKITSPKKHGIFLEVKSYAKSITGNTISAAAQRGIAVYAHSAKMSITKNKIAKCKGNAIFIDGRGSKYKITVKSNKITGKASVANVKVKSGKVSVSGSKKAK